MRAKLTGYIAALTAVAAVTLAIGFTLGNVSLATGSMLYLLAVLATAVAFGRGPAIFASLLAFLVFDWFFVEPEHTFTISESGLIGDGLDRMASLLQHLARGLDTKALYRLGWGLARFIAEGTAELARA